MKEEKTHRYFLQTPSVLIYSVLLNTKSNQLMMNKFSTFCLFFHLVGTSFSQMHLSPQAIATAQTYGTFSDVVEALSWNPAILGYGDFDSDTLIISQLETKESPGFRIQLFASSIYETADSLKSILDTLVLGAVFIVEEDSIFKVQVVLRF